MSLALDRDRALAHFEQAWALGRTLGGPTRERLRELLIDMLDRYPDRHELRGRILASLERDFGEDRRFFPGLGRVEIALFVLLERLDDLPDDREHAGDRLDLLREVLIRHGDSRIDGEPARTWAMRHCQALLERHGREVYARFEKEARRLFDEASGSPARLKVVLDRYPNSETALHALVHLVRSAASRGELETALQAWSMARTRLGTLPAELYGSMAQAARGAGNALLAAAFEARGAGRIPGTIPMELEEHVKVPPRRGLRLTDNETLDGTLKPMTPVRVAGFTQEGDLPLLVWSSVGKLYAYKRQATADGPGYDFTRPLFLRPFVAEPFPLTMSLHGSVLVLPEGGLVRGIDVADHGRLRWSFRVPDGAAGDERPPWISACGPLATGLYGLCVCRGSGDGMVVDLVGIEPLTGTQMFKVRLPGVRPYSDYEFRHGQFFYLVDNTEGMGERLVVRDGLDGSEAVHYDFDGGRLPQLSIRSTASLLPTPTGLYFLTRDDQGRPPGLFAYDATGKRLWVHREPGATVRDRFVVFDSQVMLVKGLGRADVAAHAVLLDRESGDRVRDVVIGKQAWLPGRPAVPTRVPDGPVLFLARGTGAKTRALLLDPRPDRSSWITDLAWPREELDRSLLPQVPILGDGFVVLARGRDFGRSSQLELLLLSLDDGEVVPDPGYRSGAFPAEVELGVWNGQLLLQRRDGQTWVYVDTMGR
ncbi:MAG: hypothetical protein R3F30_08565 [Planctomycetota bacterium]